jgi:hypothetical protein
MGPQDLRDVTQAIARDLTGIVGEIASLKGDANQWLAGAEYEGLRHRQEMAHARAEVAEGEDGRAALVRKDSARSRSATEAPQTPVVPTRDCSGH